MSLPVHGACGPESPNGEMETRTSLRFISSGTPSLRPRRSAAPEPVLSSTRSAQRQSLRPLRALRARPDPSAGDPWRRSGSGRDCSGPRPPDRWERSPRRVGSPSFDSTFTTSAPRSARSFPPYGPATPRPAPERAPRRAVDRSPCRTVARPPRGEHCRAFTTGRHRAMRRCSPGIARVPPGWRRPPGARGAFASCSLRQPQRNTSLIAPRALSVGRVPSPVRSGWHATGCAEPASWA